MLDWFKRLVGGAGAHSVKVNSPPGNTPHQRVPDLSAQEKNPADPVSALQRADVGLNGVGGAPVASSLSPSVTTSQDASSPVAPDCCADPVGVLPDLDVDVMYFNWLIGATEAVSERHVLLEKSILQALAKLCESPLGSAELLPRVPAVLPQLLKSLRDEEVSGAVLASQISKDVVLVAELLLEVNSSYYHQSVKITTLDHAILVLGQNGLRMLVARVAFRPLIHGLGSGYFSKRVVPLIWEQSEKCALAGGLLAQQARLDPFPVFLAGLIHDVGLIVALRVADSFCDAVSGKISLPRSRSFDRQFLTFAHRLTQRIGREWDFPAAVMDALDAQSDAGYVEDADPLEFETISSEQYEPDFIQVLANANYLSKIAILMRNAQIHPEDERVISVFANKNQACLTALGIELVDDAGKSSPTNQME